VKQSYSAATYAWKLQTIAFKESMKISLFHVQHTAHPWVHLDFLAIKRRFSIFHVKHWLVLWALSPDCHDHRILA